MVEIQDLSLSYPGAAQPSICGVDLTVPAGEFLTLLGPSGCGKTSTLRSIAGLETPTGGAIRIGDQTVFDTARRINVPTQQRDIAMVFQSYAVWPHMTVGENVAFPLEVAGLARDKVRERVAEALTLVGLQDLAQRAATRLSGGQQQRVAIARALVRGASVMLLDEPLSNLDAKLREQMRIELRQLLKRVNMTSVYVTHDQEEALMLSDRIALMRAGRLVEVGAPQQLYLRPSTVFGATFLGAAEILPVTGRASARVCSTPVGEFEVELACDGASHLGIRPEAILVRAAAQARTDRPNCLSGQLESVVFGGRQQHLSIELAGGRRLNAMVEATLPFAAGQPVQIELPASRLMALAQESP